MNAVESISSMPWSRRTAATAPMRPSVFRQRSFVEHGKQRGIGQQPRRENLGVLHLAGHDRVGDAGLLQQLDARAELPERDPVDRALHPGGGVVELGKGLFPGGDDGDVVPLRNRRVEDEKRKSAVACDQSNLQSRRTRRHEGHEGHEDRTRRIRRARSKGTKDTTLVVSS